MCMHVRAGLQFTCRDDCSRGWRTLAEAEQRCRPLLCPWRTDTCMCRKDVQHLFARKAAEGFGVPLQGLNRGASPGCVHAH